MTMTNKLFEAASFVGDICNAAVYRIEKDFAKKEDTEKLISMNKRQLHKELARQERELVKLTNWGGTVPAEQHSEMVERRQLIKFLLNPASVQGSVSLR